MGFRSILNRFSCTCKLPKPESAGPSCCEEIVSERKSDSTQVTVVNPGMASSPQAPIPAPLAASPQMEYNKNVEQIRQDEYPNMNRGAYLDHGGATIYAKSLVSDVSDAMMSQLWGNPHSENLPAKLSGEMVDSVRAKALRFLGADAEHYDLVFVANATAAIKTVADSFRDMAENTVSRSFWYGYHSEVHSSILGVRQLSGDYHCFDSNGDVEEWLAKSPSNGNNTAETRTLGLFAYPGQSNLTGRRLPLTWTARVRSHPRLQNTYTLFDAAALAMTAPLHALFSDPESAPDFTCLSFYKVFGFPDLGALVVRRASGHVLNLRKYFGGGTIAQLFPLNGDARVWRKGPGMGGITSNWDIHDGLEDGTLPFHSILALGLAIDAHARIYGSMDVISRHCSYLSRFLYLGLAALRHPDGSPLVEMYVEDAVACGDPSKHGGTIAFNVIKNDGAYVPWTIIEAMANKANVYIRAGGACCPGGISRLLRYEDWEWSRIFSSGHSCGWNSVAVINAKPTGIVRASLGPMSTKADVCALLRFLHDAFIASEVAQP